MHQADLGKVPCQIADTNGDVYNCKTKAEYLAAEKKFKPKWTKKNEGVRVQVSDYANDEFSFLKTARKSAGTQVCYHKGEGEPCKTFGPDWISHM